MGRIFGLAVLLAVVSVQMQAQNNAPQGSTGTSSANTSTDSAAEPKSKTVSAEDQHKDSGNNNKEKPEYDKKSLEVLTGVGAVLAGVEATSYKVDTTSNALSQTDVGRKTIELLLGGGFILPWHWGGNWIESSFCEEPEKKAKNKKENKEKKDKKDGKEKEGDPKADAGAAKDAEPDKNKDKGACREGGDPDYKHYRPWESFLSIRFTPASDQTINGFVVGGGYRITKYFSLLGGYSVTPVEEPTHGFRVAAAQVVAANPTISPYNHYNASDLLNNKPGAFDGFPLFLYNASGVTTTKIFPTSPTVTHYRSGIYFGVGIPVDLTKLFKTAK